MKNPIALFCGSIISLNLFANFLVRNDGEKPLKILLVFQLGYETRIPSWIIPAHQQYELSISEGLKNLARIEAWDERQDFCYTQFRIPSKSFGDLLINAKKYLPLIILNFDPIKNVPTINIPTTEKALQEAIEKVKEQAKKEKAKEISKKVSEAVPQLPCGAERTGQITGLIGELAAEVEE